MANYITSLVYTPNHTIKTSKVSKSEEVIIYLDAMVHPLPSITFCNGNTPFSSSHPPSPPSNQPMLQIMPPFHRLGFWYEVSSKVSTWNSLGPNQHDENEEWKIVKTMMLSQTRKCKKWSKLISYVFIPKEQPKFWRKLFIHNVLELCMECGLSNTPNNKCGTNLALTYVEGGTRFLVFHDKLWRSH